MNIDELEFRALSVSGDMRFGYITKDAPNSTSYYNEYPYWNPLLD